MQLESKRSLSALLRNLSDYENLNKEIPLRFNMMEQTFLYSSESVSYFDCQFPALDRGTGCKFRLVQENKLYGKLQDDNEWVLDFVLRNLEFIQKFNLTLSEAAKVDFILDRILSKFQEFCLGNKWTIIMQLMEKVYL